MGNKLNRLAAVYSVLAIVCSGIHWTSDVLAQSKGGAGSTRQEKRVIEGFTQTLGKGLKIFNVVVWSPKAGSDVRFVVAITKDNNDLRPKLRVFEDSARGYIEELVVHAGDQPNNLYLKDINGDGFTEALSSWDCGQLECLSIIGYDKSTNGVRELFSAAGQKIETRSARDGTTEIVTTRRTYKEKAGEPFTMATDVFRWNGSTFAEVAGKDSKK
jgi:hypothetical protein